MSVMLVAMFLPLLLLHEFIPVTSREVSVQVVSFNEVRNMTNGPVRCALDTANETSSSSLYDCTLGCANDGTCTGFNIKNSLTCEVYNYNPKITVPVPGCTFYKVRDNLNFIDITS